MPIKGWSQARQLQRLGMIRLGVKAKNDRGVEYPTSTDYFVVPPEVAAKFGAKPKVLDVRLPLNGDNDNVFPNFWKLYGKSTGLKSYSDGETVWDKTQVGEKAVWLERKLGSDEDLQKLGYRPTGTLDIMIPNVSMAGVYRLVTGSFYSIRNVNTSLDLIRSIFGRVSGIPLKLHLVPQETNQVKDGKTFKKIVYVLQIRFETSDIMKHVEDRKKFLHMFNDDPVALDTPAEEEEPDEAPEAKPVEIPEQEQTPEEEYGDFMADMGAEKY